MNAAPRPGALPSRSGHARPPAPPSLYKTFRGLEQWVRWVLIQTYVQPGDSVLDLMCGRGIDAASYAEVGVRRYVGVDANPEDLAATRAKWVAAQQEFGMGGGASGEGGGGAGEGGAGAGDAGRSVMHDGDEQPAATPVELDLLRLDILREPLGDALSRAGAASSGSAGTSMSLAAASSSSSAPASPGNLLFDVISCQGRLDHAFVDAATTRRTLAAVAAHLQEDGVFIGYVVDAARVLELAREAGYAASSSSLSSSSLSAAATANGAGGGGEAAVGAGGVAPGGAGPPKPLHIQCQGFALTIHPPAAPAGDVVGDVDALSTPLLAHFGSRATLTYPMEGSAPPPASAASGPSAPPPASPPLYKEVHSLCPLEVLAAEARRAGLALVDATGFADYHQQQQFAYPPTHPRHRFVDHEGAIPASSLGLARMYTTLVFRPIPKAAAAAAGAGSDG